ncbi:hypothetical protein IFM89_000735 [Coptis chinensis]|uniref:Uncharacterized protein n=1 Tax=Coptis chinensis TaxID=261450 RepID=A0A835MGU9_9MAGN|nr:hypothetical protein IFM89_000735 [Coptis chinensis]
MLSKILTFEIGWFDQDENSTGAICARLTKDASVEFSCSISQVRSLVGDRMAHSQKVFVTLGFAGLALATARIVISFSWALDFWYGGKLVSQNHITTKELFQEATSALDSQSENVVQEALDRVMVNRTSVVVAHRLSTIQNCDQIAVLDQRALVEKGTHSSLLEREPMEFTMLSSALKESATRTDPTVD